MRIKNKKYFIPAIIVIAGGLAVGTARLLEVPPFEQVGTIDASDICEGLGSSDSRVQALKNVLPEQTEYSFGSLYSEARIDQSDSSYTSRCSVRGEGSVLLYTNAELMRDEPVDSWASSTIADRQADYPGDFDDFAAGKGGVVSSHKAAILLPCVSAGRIPGGEYSISVSVTLNQQSENSVTTAKEALKDLVLSTAEFVHKDARCDLPSRLPESL
ncbi:hypothetical protein [Streptomyces pratensis]|uniref:hypothetical protein n=1 Tax=Streptomyces pratensis TaxID=1169025 RepID=UPI00193152A1|nr:hypothetical protein [Streptomyces pratensis]